MQPVINGSVKKNIHLIHIYRLYKECSLIMTWQNYIGTFRTTVTKNRDVVKELKIGMFVTTTGGSIARIGTVKTIPPNPCYEL